MSESYQRTVRYYETDQMGIVHHSNYIRFFEEARTDYWDQAGLHYHALEQEGLLVPVLSCACHYKKPLRFPQTFSIEVKLTSFNGVRFGLKYRVFVEGEKNPVAFGETEHCLADRNLRPVRVQKTHPHIWDKIQLMLADKA